jgi:secondary thiamine-phosphate synthase enzyme
MNVTKLHTESFELQTRGRGLFDVTSRVQDAVRAAAVTTGLCTVFVHHTSASLLINENADPAVLADLERFMARLVPDGDPLFRHVDEGPDDMPSHVRAALTQSALSIPVAGGRCDLGTWQGVYLWEHRHAPHRRRLTLTVLGA